jgi:hypothetical protein
MTVFVVQDIKGKAFEGADSFGDLNIIFEVGSSAVITAIPSVRKLNESLKNFSDDDFLLLSGDPVLIGLATSVAANNNHGRVAFLKWDRKDRSYYPLKADLNHENTAPNLPQQKPLHLSRKIGPRLSNQKTPSLWDVFCRWVRRY